MKHQPEAFQQLLLATTIPTPGLLKHSVNLCAVLILLILLFAPIQKPEPGFFLGNPVDLTLCNRTTWGEICEPSISQPK